MPNKRLDRGLGLTVLLGMAVWGMNPSAHSQTPPQTGVPLHKIQPTLNMEARVTSNSEFAKGGTGVGKKEMILSVTPGIGFQIKGTQSELVGQFQLEGLRYVRASQPDIVLPKGDVRLNMEAVKDKVGFDASLTSAQVRADPSTGDEASSNSYTDTNLELAPYVRGQLDSHTMAEIRLARRLVDSTPNNDALPTRPDAHLSDDRVRVLRQPTPFGYEILLSDKRDRDEGAPHPALAERQGSLALLMAPDADVTVGLKLVHARDSIRDRRYSDTFLGYQAEWRPTPRSVFQARMADRLYGRTWSLDLKHRWRLVSAEFKSERMATTYARQTGQISTGQPAPPFDPGAQLSHVVQGRMVIMGRRNQLTFAVGHIKSAAIVEAGPNVLTTAGVGTRTRYFETELTHRVTPLHDLVGGLKWEREQPILSLVTVRRFDARAALNTRLTPDTTATMGLRRQITHSSSTTSANETAGYVGLGHSF